MTTDMTPVAPMNPASATRVPDSHRSRTEPAGRPRHTAFTGFAALIAVEALKLRRSSVWVVALILPVLAVVSGSVNYMMNRSQLSHGWDGLTSQVFIFYGMFFCSLGLALLAAASWRPEHRSTSWNAMRTTGHSPVAVVAAKTLVLTAPAAAMQMVVMLLTWAVGAGLGLGAALPAAFVAECLLSILAAQPLIAVQSLLSMRMRSFAAPVAVCVPGLVVSMALVMKGSWVANVWPQALVTRALTLGSTAVSGSAAMDVGGVATLLAGTALSALVCWGLLITVARRTGGAR